MRSKVLHAGILSAVLAVCAGALVASPAAANPAATYYVSVGDSLATGYQPDTETDDPVSYTDKIYAALKQNEPNLQHIRLGCDGETTVTMLNGGKCGYTSDATQVDDAVARMKAHPGQIKYVTNNIGANDIYRCVSGGAPDVGCIASNLVTIQENLKTIDTRLREAGGTGAVYVGMTYYNPMLSSWLQGGTSEVIAAVTTALSNVLNQTISLTNSANGWKTADVATAFSTNDFGNPVDLPGIGSVPKNVAQLCTWTWMCKVGDIHANPVGHQVMADTFLPLLTTDDEGGAAGSLGSLGSVGALVG